MKQFMKRLLFITAGAILVGVTVSFLLGVFAEWYVPRFIKNDDDISTAYLYLGLTQGAFL